MLRRFTSLTSPAFKRYYSTATTSEHMSERLNKLRGLMKREKVDAYLVVSEDYHSSEYISRHDMRRSWISGFDGSAGTAVIKSEEAILFTDGRYHQQAGKQLSSDWSLMKVGLTDVPTWQEYLARLPKATQVGFDPALLSVSDFQTLSKTSTLVPITSNLIDEIWADQPSQTANPVFRLEDKYAGQSARSKISQIRKEIQKAGALGMIVSLLDEIAWTLNLRGTDIDFNPVFFSYLYIPLTTPPTLFVNLEQLPTDVYAYIIASGILIEPYDSVIDHLKKVGAELEPDDRVVVPSRTNYALASALGRLDRIETGYGPICHLKSIKNATEIAGFHSSHLRDGVALVQYFSWLENSLKNGDKVSESQGGDKLESLRKPLDLFRGLSFGTITSTGANASIIHYSPDPLSCPLIDINQIHLCDSGAQFLDGTTDTTRTHHFGTPKPEEIRAYTRVLQGHIAIDTAIFPPSTTGYIIDSWARKALWQDGMNYMHGTSHGVGHALNVHEGPTGLGTRIEYNNVKLAAGMVLSNEPGYYEPGKYGIRIENVVVVKEVDTLKKGGYLGFERVTMCPIATNLVDVTLLTPAELSWINTYHVEVLAKLERLVEATGDEIALKWLRRSCMPLTL